MTNEEWRPVVGYEGLYEVSNLGRVRSVTTKIPGKDGRTCARKGRILKHTIGDYARVAPSKNGVPATKKVCRLVAEAFFGPPLGRVVDHIDRNRLNDAASNLRWATVSENAMNSKRPINNTSGLKGVSWDKVNEKWLVVLTHQGVQRHIGRFCDKDAAHRAYMEHARALAGEFATEGV